MKKPMLAVEAPEVIRYPVMASAKLDGVRGIVEKVNGVAQIFSRSGKLFPNKFVELWFSQYPELEGLDGELIVGSPNAKDVYRVTNSAVMSIEGQPDFMFYVFDMVNFPNETFVQRNQRLLQGKWRSGYPTCKELPHRVVILQQVQINDDTALRAYEEKVLQLGYEGLILRSLDSPYKFGRSTANEGFMLKVRRFKDSEAVIVGAVEELENTNEATLDVFGHTERSSKKDGMVGKGTLGSFIVEDLKTGVRFNVGTGFDADERKKYWRHRSALNGKFIKYRYFEVGVKDLPRFPVFQGFRDKIDM